MTENKNAVETAQFRFGLIAPVVQGIVQAESNTAYFKRITKEPILHPDGTLHSYSYKTLEKWAHEYKKGGLDALMPKTRIDKGSSRVLSDVAIEEICRIKQDFPRINATQIHAKLIRDGFITFDASVDAVQRYIRHNELKGTTNANIRDRKAFEEESFGRMWQADTCYFPHITENGQSKRTYCIMIIDDYSRLVVGGGIFYSDNAYNFQKVLKDAVKTYGLPHKLFVDNGATYANEQLAMICVSLGISLVHTRVRDGASKGKIERFWRSTKERLIYPLDMKTITSLEQFNSVLKDYMRTYNLTYHTGIGSSPMERFERTINEMNVPFSSDWVDDCFYNRISRKVKKDATISIDKTSYDVPLQFNSTTVEVRYLPDAMEDAFIFFEGKKYPIKKTNKIENCRTKRNNTPSIDYSKVGGAK